VWRPWLNAALKTLRDVELARAEVTACGLPPHPDDPKNWDLLIALGLILERYSRRARVLDAGATQYSRLLPWLYLYGFRNLHGIDLVYKRPIQAGPIRYEQMDLTRTQFRDRSFDAITCLSVIEHGVDPEAYLREMSRLLRPGGLLVTSTDFWCEPLDLVGKSAYGVPVKIFGPSEVESLVRLAGQWDLHLAGELDLRCQDKAVDWTRMGLQYTFVNVVLKKARGRRRDRT
jgi:SAM-dependent methyltransferase